MGITDKNKISATNSHGTESKEENVAQDSTVPEGSASVGVLVNRKTGQSNGLNKDSTSKSSAVSETQDKKDSWSVKSSELSQEEFDHLTLLQRLLEDTHVEVVTRDADSKKRR